jgi:uroporphyrinogen III methyltransferase / synthase
LSKRGVVYLVGAGPGDPGLITRRGAELLARADVVAYDRLVHPDLLKLARNAELVDVGKQPGESAPGQERINQLLVDEARAGKVVVRLKGGDPFVFGRGGEEAELLAAAGVPFEIVPGVTSAVAGPAYAGIPLTHRDHASWVAIATGHLSEGAPDGGSEEPTKESSALDWEALARAPTSVFLMGIQRLGEISRGLQNAGRLADSPAAVISWATWPRQRVLRSTLEKVADAVQTADISPPAVLVVGDVVTLNDSIDWLSRKPLLGKRVFVTRTRAQAGRLSEALRELGAEALEFPAIQIVEPTSYGPLDEALAGLSSFGWIVFTSRNTVDAVWSRLREAGKDARALARLRVAAVGPATSEALRAHGVEPDLVPETFTSESLAEAFGSPPAQASGGSVVLLPQAEDAPDDLSKRLGEKGWGCVAVNAYRTEVDDSSVAAGRQVLDEGVDAVLFTSGSTARNFVELWGLPAEGTIVCCIGPRTDEVAREAGIHVDAVAAEHTIEGLVNALVAAVGR